MRIIHSSDIRREFHERQTPVKSNRNQMIEFYWMRKKTIQLKLGTRKCYQEEVLFWKSKALTLEQPKQSQSLALCCVHDIFPREWKRLRDQWWHLQVFPLLCNEFAWNSSMHRLPNVPNKIHSKLDCTGPRCKFLVSTQTQRRCQSMGFGARNYLFHRLGQLSMSVHPSTLDWFRILRL